MLDPSKVLAKIGEVLDQFQSPIGRNLRYLSKNGVLKIFERVNTPGQFSTSWFIKSGKLIRNFSRQKPLKIENLRFSISLNSKLTNGKSKLYYNSVIMAKFTLFYSKTQYTFWNFSRPYPYSRRYYYCFIHIIPPVPLFQTVCLFWTLE